ncbi:MAG: transketolase [Planctomycetota bacterium]|jgi:transketolase
MARPIPNYDSLAADFPQWEKVGDMMDQCIDLMLNLRQSGHPGGSRSKVQTMVALTLSGAMRWDVRRPDKAFGDKFVLVAGHCVPVIYAMLAVYNEALRRMHQKTGDEKYAVYGGEERTLVWEDLLELRHNGGLSGHAEAEGKTMIFAANTGPSGHGAPVAAGIALALKHAGAEEVKVFAVAGEGGPTAGCHHETKHTSWGLGLGNLNYLLDWNDNGIDPRAYSDMVHGGPEDWFKPYGWRTEGVENGTDYAQLTKALLANVHAEGDQPRCTWFKTEKGRGYGVTGYASHGAAHKPNSPVFWETKEYFAGKYGLSFQGQGEERPASDEDFRAQTAQNLETTMSLLDDETFCAWLADRLVALGDSVPTAVDGFNLSDMDPTTDPELTDPARLPESVFIEPGTMAPNRKGFAMVGAHLNAVARRKYGRPVVIACSADLADSTNISGFAKDSGDQEGFGWYDRKGNTAGALLPTTITEFGNAGLMCGLASTNMAADPEKDFVGFWSACSTYGSFSYLKYGPMRLYSQLVQDSPLKMGKVIWVAGHSGPETAEDSRTHFGIFSPGVTQFFPRGQVMDIHPYEPNEVGPCLLAALAQDVPIVALHLTRPNIEVPDREALGMASHMDAAKGAYLIRDYDPSRPADGCIFLRGTSSTASVVKLLKDGAFDGDGPNIKIVAAVSHELFMLQPESYRDSIASKEDWFNSTCITNGARQMMWLWTAHQTSYAYSMGSDWDNRWRTGGSGDEICEEAHLDPKNLLAGIQRFVDDREARFEAAGAPVAAQV